MPGTSGVLNRRRAREKTPATTMRKSSKLRFIRPCQTIYREEAPVGVLLQYPGSLQRCVLTGAFA
jgi:hypothetical protein